MAGIDKTYIDGCEYRLYRDWWITNYEKMKKELGDYIWLYTFGFFYPNEPDEFTPEFLESHTRDIDYYSRVNDFPIWNTSESTDRWLVKNCEIASYRAYLLSAYSAKWKGFKGQKWVPKKNYKPKYVR